MRQREKIWSRRSGFCTPVIYNVFTVSLSKSKVMYVWSQFSAHSFQKAIHVDMSRRKVKSNATVSQKEDMLRAQQHLLNRHVSQRLLINICHLSKTSLSVFSLSRHPFFRGQSSTLLRVAEWYFFAIFLKKVLSPSSGWMNSFQADAEVFGTMKSVVYVAFAFRSVVGIATC